LLTILLFKGEHELEKFTVSVFINRSQQDVFGFLSNPANLSKWDSDFESAEWISSDVPGIGSTYRASGKRLGSEKDGFFEIVQWDRPNKYSYKVKERMFLFDHAETAITLKPKDNGTEATFESQFEIVGRLKFAEGFVARMGKKRIEGNLNAAKRLLEAG
jgi:carbon monoxide dehydrogenase subunit G